MTINNNAYDFSNPYELARFVKESVKVTPVTLYIKGTFDESALSEYEYYGSAGSYTVFTEAPLALSLVENLGDSVTSYRIIQDRRNSAIPMLDMIPVNARIEPGAVIREGAIIEDNAVIMMGAVINLGAVVGEETMIDMNAVLGARATIGKRCHIGAGAVIAGVLEPPSATPVIIEDNVLVGANAVVLEGVRVGEGAVVAAGAVVTTDVAPNTVVAGSPATVVKQADDKTREKTEILDDLRK